ncbi:MAG: acetyl-CoA carboxylase biotin carboxyl carrier protein subunit, partial [Actinomycetota bacterium]
MAAPGEHVRAGAPAVVIESMKMEHDVCTESDVVIRSVAVAAGQTVMSGDELLRADPAVLEVMAAASDAPAAVAERDDLVAVRERHLQ